MYNRVLSDISLVNLKGELWKPYGRGRAGLDVWKEIVAHAKKNDNTKYE